MLSFADPPVLAFEVPFVPFVAGVEVLAAMGVPLVAGVAEGIVFNVEVLVGGFLEMSEDQSALILSFQSQAVA